MKNYHLDILTERQKDLLPKFRHFKDKGFYLAGGTGLTLQLGHRTSADFDFYSLKTFSNEELALRIKKSVENLKIIQVQENTLILECEDVLTSLFFYPYPLLMPLIKTKDILIASLEDIAAMKLVAIIQRGIYRDFIDMYYLIKKLGLKNILSASARKYKEMNVYLALQSLLYFEDAKKDERIRIKENIKWETIKSYIINEVKKVEKNHSTFAG